MEDSTTCLLILEPWCVWFFVIGTNDFVMKFTSSRDNPSSGTLKSNVLLHLFLKMWNASLMMFWAGFSAPVPEFWGGGSSTAQVLRLRSRRCWAPPIFQSFRHWKPGKNHVKSWHLDFDNGEIGEIGRRIESNINFDAIYLIFNIHLRLLCVLCIHINIYEYVYGIYII